MADSDSPSRAPSVLHTARLSLRAAHSGDVPALGAYYARNAERFARFEPPRPSDAQSIARYLEALREYDARFGAVTAFLAFVKGDDESVAGEVRLDGFASQPLPSAMLAYTIDGALEGRGFASEAVSAVLDYAFQTLGLRTITANYNPTNLRSERLLQRNGFQLLGAVPPIAGLEHLMRSNASAVLAR